MKIVVDDREKQPYSFPAMDTESARLNVGDYSVKGFDDVFAVERKSLDDLARSVGTDRGRFEAEIERAQTLDNFAVVVEATIEDAYKGKYYSKIHPNAVVGTVKKWPWKYGVLEFHWCGDRDGAKQETLRLLDQWYLQSATDLF